MKARVSALPEGRLDGGTMAGSTLGRDGAANLRWVALTAGVSVALAVGLALIPVWTGVVVAAGLTTAVAMTRPKVAAAGAFLAVAWSRELAILSGASILGYLDEAAVVAVAVLFSAHRSLQGKALRGIPGGRWFLLWAAIGIASSLAGGVPASLFLQSGFLSAKGVLLAFAIAQLDWVHDDIRRIARFGAWLLAVVLLCAMVQLAIPDVWASYFASTGVADRRNGPPSLIGPFAHPGEFGLIAASGAVAVLAWRSVVGKSGVNTLLLGASAVGALLSFRRKAIIGLLLSGLLVSIKTNLQRTVLVVVLTLPLALFLAWSTIMSVVRFTAAEYLTNPDGTARIVLTRDSFSVALENFPFGAGFGRFGSFLAGVHYSPEYLERGYPGIWGLGPNAGESNALTDTQWPAAVGETGLFGALALAIAFVAVYRRGKAVFGWSHADSSVRWIGLVCMGWSVQFAVESAASAVYNSPPMYPLLFGVVGIVAALRPAGSDRAGHPREVVAGRSRFQIDRRGRRR